MSKPREETPDTWADWGDKIQHAGADIYYSIIGDGVKVGEKASNVWVWHWHRAPGHDERWQLAACGLHTVEQVEPLTLSPSLACENGCPSHGYIENGSWRSV